MTDPVAFQNFKTAACKILKFLQARLGFGLWMVTRTSGDDWIVLASESAGGAYQVVEGDVFRWTDSFCYHMVQGKTPRFAPRSSEVPEYASAPIGKQVSISAYIGVPLLRKDGSLFGTLCAIDPEPQSDALKAELPLVELLSKLLSTVLEAEASNLDAMTDPLTGLGNRRHWDLRMTSEESRCRRYGNPACVLSIDLDRLKLLNDSKGHSSGDELLKLAAVALRQACRDHDVIARLGGDEFGVLAVECDFNGGKKIVERLESAFQKNNVKASIGMALRRSKQTLNQAWEEADQAMYVVKRSRGDI